MTTPIGETMEKYEMHMPTLLSGAVALVFFLTVIDITRS